MNRLLEKNEDVRMMDCKMSSDKESQSRSVHTEPTPRDHIKKAAYHIKQALFDMEIVEGHIGTSDEVRKRIQKIIEVFSIDKSELERIIDIYFDKRP